MENNTQTQGATEAQKSHSAASIVGWVITAVAFAVLGYFTGSVVTDARNEKATLAAQEAAAALRASQATTVESFIVTDKVVNPPSEFMGHVESIEATDLRAQIEGTIEEVTFKEGAMVKAGDVLFRIDSRVYSARVAQAKAALAQAIAASENADSYYARISKVDKRAVTEAEVDKARADMLEAKATIEQCKADLASAEINLGYTQIIAPISGRIGQSILKKGDYVAPSMGSLARIVQTDPVRVVFSLPDVQFLRTMKLADESGKLDAVRAQLRLADGSVYEQDGALDFVSNEMNSSTASLPVRYSFANPTGILVANAYVTVLLSNANPKTTLVVPTNALLSNVEGDYIYVIKDGKAVKRMVKLGAENDGYAEVLSGVEAGEEVITNGVVNVREGGAVNVIKAEKNVTSDKGTAGEVPVKVAIK